MSRPRHMGPHLSVCKLPGGCRRAVLCAPVCAERPDASGSHPDAARTDPDTTQQGAADQDGNDPDDVRTEGDSAPGASRDTMREAVAYLQDSGEHFAAGLLDGWLSVRADEPDDRHSVEQGGPDPDDLRTRLAVALLARIKLATVGGPQPFGHDALTSLFAATEYDLADTALTALLPELDELADYRNRLTWETTCGEHAKLLDACRAADEAREEAEAEVARVTDLMGRYADRGITNGQRAEAAEAKVAAAQSARDSAAASAATLLSGVIRVRQMIDAWEQQLPEMIRTATAVDAIRTALTAPTRPAEQSDDTSSET